MPQRQTAYHAPIYGADGQRHVARRRQPIRHPRLRIERVRIVREERRLLGSQDRQEIVEIPNAALRRRVRQVRGMRFRDPLRHLCRCQSRRRLRDDERWRGSGFK